ncbi:GNAT family N-acetyltransferase [Arthrobacter jiangjiafuii]|uniref:GNAT family N-acetyltransferase n=1 Tax=Arthrobacter jiangjiafuii TaxID=2817475 RepID=A0A975M6B8_9MICC|nr:GNAT family protein [Arthrobacter jiangjiafuii]MBP3045022.1 GNAT family N-acetyltransferase [Arthrobacter jiangjiafuii]QWC10650.1 GNAT family N-acetyltransferase [Arthrobacter jiangjiafuii]
MSEQPASAPASFLAPVTLAGRHVILEPLSTGHIPGLVEAVHDGELWNTWYTRIPTPSGMAAEVEARLARHTAGTMVPFALRRTDTGAVCGMTTYMNIRTEHRRLEIGSTWLAASAQRTMINTEAKLLLLTRAFEDLDCIAVEFRTHWHNHPSRAAIARLGAKQDGVLRNQDLWTDGTLRDVVVFSIIESEWPTVRLALSSKLAGKLRRS